jgi:hypothetical protein
MRVPQDVADLYSDNTAGTATGLHAGRSGFQILARARDVSLLQHSTLSHPAS